jgi:cell division septum initiation protein DivIVA
MKEAARRESQLILREATLSAEKLMEEARAEEAKIHTEIQSLKRVRRQLIEDLREILQRYDRSLTADLGEGGTGAERRD